MLIKYHKGCWNNCQYQKLIPDFEGNHVSIFFILQNNSAK